MLQKSMVLVCMMFLTTSMSFAMSDDKNFLNFNLQKLPDSFLQETKKYRESDRVTICKSLVNAGIIACKSAICPLTLCFIGGGWSCLRAFDDDDRYYWLKVIGGGTLAAVLSTPVTLPLGACLAPIGAGMSLYEDYQQANDNKRYEKKLKKIVPEYLLYLTQLVSETPDLKQQEPTKELPCKLNKNDFKRLRRDISYKAKKRDIDLDKKSIKKNLSIAMHTYLCSGDALEDYIINKYISSIK